MSELRLRYAMTPDNAEKFALDIASHANERMGACLDFSPASLSQADTLIDEARNAGAPMDAVGEFLFELGCYLGQVLVKNAGSTWVFAAGTEMAPHAVFPLILRLKDGTHAQPIPKAFKRFIEGPEQSLHEFYRVFESGGIMISAE